MSRYILLQEARHAGETVSDDVSAAFGRVRDRDRGLGSLSAKAEDMNSHQIVDRIGKDGPSVVELHPAVAQAMRNAGSRWRPVPIRRYVQALAPMQRTRRLAAYRQDQASVQVRLTLTTKDKRPVEGADVVVVLDKQTGFGLPRRATTKDGRVTLTFPGVARAAELLIYPRHSVWGYRAENIDLFNQQTIELQEIDLAATGMLGQLVCPDNVVRGKGVKVGVVDSGVDSSHPDLTLAGGANFTPWESDESDYGAGADGHGTHVAGIVCGRGKLGEGMRGVAPDATLYSYRVFQKQTGKGTDSVAIGKAIARAVDDGCDLINLSLGGGAPDEGLSTMIGRAFEAGVLCVVAAGNAGRRPVSYPAHIKRALAVSAVGRRGTFPEHSIETGYVEAPFSGSDPELFVAGFSNIGWEVDCTAPGVGVVSCFPGGKYAVMSGTSMACPAVTGVAAAILGDNPALLNADRNADRVRSLVAGVRAVARDVGLGLNFQGFGLPEPHARVT